MLIPNTIQHISVDELKNALQNWHMNRPIDHKILRLAMPLEYQVESNSIVVRLKWFTWLHDFVLTELTTLRQMVNQDTEITTPQTIDDILDQLTKDFSSSSKSFCIELSEWSALYHRYFISISLPPPILAEHAGLSERHFRRKINQGLLSLSVTLMINQIRQQTKNNYFSDLGDGNVKLS